MEMRYSEEQRLIQDAARALLGEKVTHEARLAAEASSAGYDRELWRQIVELGWLGAADADRANFETLAILSEELGRVVAATPFHGVVATMLLLAEHPQCGVATKHYASLLEGRSIAVPGPA